MRDPPRDRSQEAARQVDSVPGQAALAGIIDLLVAQLPEAGVALVLGPVSNLYVIDVDGREAHDVLMERLGSEPQAPKAVSGSGLPYRYHLYFLHPDLATKAKATPWHPNLEFRGYRGIIVAPPSRHRSGNRYAWAPGRSPNDLALPPVPLPILQSLRTSKWTKPCRASVSGSKKPVKGVNASSRTLAFLSGKYAEGPHWNQKLFHAACDLCGRGMPLEMAKSLLLAGALPWNRGEEETARRTIQSAFSQRRQPGRL